MTLTPEIRRDDNGDLDEFIVSGLKDLHLERMNDTQWWMGLTLKNGKRMTIRFGAVNQKAKQFVVIEDDNDEEIARA